MIGIEPIHFTLTHIDKIFKEKNLMKK